MHERRNPRRVLMIDSVAAPGSVLDTAGREGYDPYPKGKTFDCGSSSRAQDFP